VTESASHVEGQSVDIERAALEFGFLRQRMFECLAHHTGQPVDRIAHDADRDFILRGEAAVDYGLVDAVLTRRELQVVAPAAVAV